MSTPHVAIVYDWVTTPYGGAENVLLALHQAFPEAPLYTSVYNAETAPWAENWPVCSSFLQHIPGAATHHRWLALALPLAFESLDLGDFDIVLSVTSNAAKGVLTLPQQLHVSYILTPPRYVYTHRAEYLPEEWQRAVATPFLDYLQWWDQAAAFRPDKVMAISNLVASRIETSYKRPVDAVMYPPVSVPKSQVLVEKASEPTFLVVSRLVKYKRIDLAIQACLKHDWKLNIVGDGPEKYRLLKLANGNPKISFLGLAEPEALKAALETSTALLMPGIEDFGITALDAVAHGTPAVVHQESGVAEILNHKNSVFISELTPDAISTAAQKILSTEYNQVQLRQSVAKYATTTFVENIKTSVMKYWSSLSQERKL